MIVASPTPTAPTVLDIIATVYGDDTEGVYNSVPDSDWDTEEAGTQLRELLEEVELLDPLSPISTTPILESDLELSESMGVNPERRPCTASWPQLG